MISISINGIMPPCICNYKRIAMSVLWRVRSMSHFAGHVPVPNTCCDYIILGNHM